ncbi:hypothetical protein BSS2_I1671 [Brucella suis bv. 1 str. S2]|uniref:Uncharacterized protein n=3 Tax=Brucella TaxID=234 RepID=Q2YRE2_BRUA2|nr:hypothetical protein BR1726 [Brucella suis 1330]AAX75030.1 hypothetical protein BruAb1_1711 [Brucella abortus bv. 1 str. 9-941]ADZ87664.1 conserved hypothetical protein [Brucella melitensis M5-90]AEU06712.1 hypothetical protein BSVBI22_A1722 [Brucella suis VBI22]AHN47320.1 hypothetical protein BSS2_I1671 [Brucella suis bv. 1 str. S2]CAJ11695.1 conserved hypothetical protein [Brucella abortus 2308]CDL77101.1 unnamed protein product [Brucella canis str. Oliveri]SHO31494.1 predicted protein 
MRDKSIASGRQDETNTEKPFLSTITVYERSH